MLIPWYSAIFELDIFSGNLIGIHIHFLYKCKFTWDFLKMNTKQAFLVFYIPCRNASGNDLDICSLCDADCWY